MHAGESGVGFLNASASRAIDEKSPIDAQEYLLPISQGVPYLSSIRDCADYPPTRRGRFLGYFIKAAHRPTRKTTAFYTHEGSVGQPTANTRNLNVSISNPHALSLCSTPPIIRRCRR